jgi:Icc-related predicted phosphoesterase
MIIDCISDLHGHYPKLEGGDLLIVAGDLTTRDNEKGFEELRHWLIVSCLAKGAGYDKIIVIAGNHDEYVHKRMKDLENWAPLSYLCDSGTEFQGLKIWGSPWTRTFEGMNPKCKAFTSDTEEQIAEKFAMIPDDVDILVTHSPPFSVLDRTSDGLQVGSSSLMAAFVSKRIQPKLWVWGHIHEAYGQTKMDWCDTILVNASHVNERYQPVNKPIRVEL